MENKAVLAIEPAIAEQLVNLTQLIQANQTVRRFQTIEKVIAQHPEIEQLQQAIEAAQKEAVQTIHYQKPNAARLANQTADTLNQTLAANPLVQEYRAALYEANATLEYITSDLQERIDQLDD